MHIRTQLAILVLSLALPLGLLMMYTVYKNFQHELIESGELALALSQITAADTSSYFNSRQLVLGRIAERQQIKRMDAELCDPILNNFQSFDPWFGNVIVLNNSGEVVCSAIPLPGNQNISYAKADNFIRVMKYGKFVIGEPRYGAISKKWVLPLAYPIHNSDNEIIGLIGAAIDLVKYHLITSEAALPKQTEALLVTSKGTIVSYSGSSDNWIGKDITQSEIFQELTRKKTGNMQVIGLNNKDMIYGFSPVQGTNWYALIGMPTNFILSNAKTNALRDGSLGLFIIILAAIIASLLSRRIENPVRSIARAANSVAEGNHDTRLSLHGPVEIINVAKQFNRMLEMIQEEEKRLRDATDHMHLALNAANMGSWAWDIKNDIFKFSENAGPIFGMDKTDVFDNFQAFLEVVHPDDRDNLNNAIKNTMESGEFYSEEFRIVWPDNSIHWLSGKGQLINDKHGNPEQLIGICMDITERMHSDEHLRFLATHDPLTNLINRREFENRLNNALAKARSRNSQYAMLYLDLDQFKIVNDTCGHTAGDELLRQLSDILDQKIRETDTLGRLGGDEFGVLLENCPLENAKVIAEEIRKTIADYRFFWDDKSFNIGVSIGLVSISDNSMGTEFIMSAADSACFVAKDRGRNRIHIHDIEDKHLVQHHGEMEWIIRINKAMEGSRFRLYFQTIMPLTDINEGYHYEILIRMLDENDNLIPPMAFIPAAERYGVMSNIDRWIIQRSFEEINNLNSPNLDIATCAINLSATSINDKKFLDYIQEQFDTYKIPPEMICFEVTETAAIINLTQAKNFIKKLKSIGCQFALDDFGSGMSSYTYLKNLSVDYLKIDGSFVRDMINDPVDRAMVEAINKIGHVMGIKTIAEFVESDEVLDLLKKYNVDFAQGHGIAKPLPIDKLNEQFVTQNCMKSAN